MNTTIDLNIDGFIQASGLWPVEQIFEDSDLFDDSVAPPTCVKFPRLKRIVQLEHRLRFVRGIVEPQVAPIVWIAHRAKVRVRNGLLGRETLVRIPHQKSLRGCPTV